MLRVLVVAIGVACIAGAAFLAKSSLVRCARVAVFGVLVLIGTFFEGRYRARRATGSGWQRTAERFVDPVSGNSSRFGTIRKPVNVPTWTPSNSEKCDDAPAANRAWMPTRSRRILPLAVCLCCIAINTIGLFTDAILDGFAALRLGSGG